MRHILSDFILAFMVCALAVVSDAKAESVRTVSDEQLSQLYNTCLNHVAPANLTSAISSHPLAFKDGWDKCRLIRDEYSRRETAQFKAEQQEQEQLDLPMKSIIEKLTP